MENYTFNGQRTGEEVVDIANSHPYVLYPAGSRSMALLVLAVAVIVFWPKLYLIPLIIFVFVLFYMLNAIFSFRESILVITTGRIIAIEQKGFFNRKVSESDLSQIRGISSETGGMIRTMLKFGDIIISASGAREGGDIIVKNISNPYYYQQQITRLMSGQEKPMRATDSQSS